mgnify:CR=1 FL=1|tara:strand:+ start:1632 stop:2180 length:549 start_codon:yes stop_codon:yes gene_type:complete
MKTYLRLSIAIFILCTNNVLAETPAEAATPAGMTLSTNGFLDKMAMPTLYTCDGKDISPALSWAGAPEKAASFALVMKDIDAPKGPLYHWVVYNIAKTAQELPEAAPLPAGASVAVNSFDKPSYSGPCPPKGAAHTYVFTLYALDSKLTLPKDADATTTLSALKSHIIGQADITGVYSRWIQ